jgi:asparagine synthase (glutamine-hydrolysing)
LSGFCGVVSFSGLERGLLNAPMNVLKVFGGDGAGLLETPYSALGHHLRHDTPESFNEQQPYKHPVRNLYIVGDAWLDNRDELLNALMIANKDIPSSQLILAAYERWGEQCPEKLLGDFSFAIWDEEARVLWCARDHIGARPFYYYQTPDHFYFANDLEALLEFGAVRAKLDVRYVRGRLEDSRYFHPEHTYFEGVKKLPFAHTLHLSRQGLRLAAHWQPEHVKPLCLASEADYSERLLDLLNDAIKVRSRSLFEVGSHMSGGLDSTTVSVLATRQKRSRQAFTWSPTPLPSEYPLKDNDERKSMEAVATAEQFTLHYADVTVQNFLSNLSQDETRRPQHTLLVERGVAPKARGLGIRTMLSGWGGDEVVTFNGRGYFAELFRTLQWTTLLRELRTRAKLRGTGHWVKAGVLEAILPNIPAKLALSLPGARYHPAYQAAPTLPPELHPHFAALLTNVTPYKHEAAYVVPGIHTMQRRLLQHGHIAQRMEAWHAHGERLGLTYRFPLTDKRLLEFALAVPEGLFFKHGWKRYLFRRSLNGILPENLQWRKSKLDVSLTAQHKQLQPHLLDSEALLSLVETQREKLERQQFLDVAKLRDNLKHSRLDTGSSLKQDAYRSLWLVFVGEDVFI